ncbi:hypothetical protein [Streptomyces sp. NPDC000405]|uniref:hypothetical protein n=1 Tax=Streptomyces sp. NPDC000405 TaxID=3161033 RepID=UPI00398D5F95
MVRVSLRANELLVFDGRQVVARYPRLTRRYVYHDVLDHYLEVLLVKPPVRRTGPGRLARAGKRSLMASRHRRGIAVHTASRRHSGAGCRDHVSARDGYPALGSKADTLKEDDAHRALWRVGLSMYAFFQQHVLGEWTAGLLVTTTVFGVRSTARALD